MLVENKTIKRPSSNTIDRAGTGNHLATSRPAIAGQDSVSISFGSGENNKPTKTLKQYFSDLYNKVCEKILKFINSIKSFFKKPAKTQVDPNTPKDAKDKPSITLPEDEQFSKMTIEERTNKAKQLIEHWQNGKNYNDLHAEDQYFLCTLISEALKQPDSDAAEIAKELADMYEIPIEDV